MLIGIVESRKYRTFTKSYLSSYSSHCTNLKLLFSRPTSFLQKTSCRVSNEKNILNSSVERGGVEWKNWIKVISLFTFPHTFCLSLLSILPYEARMIFTCVIRRSQSLTYYFCLSISIRLHEACMIYARAFYGNF